MLAALALVSCEPATPTDGPTDGKLEVRAVPLSLGPITDAVYQVTVFNGVGDVVWTRDIASSQFGDGAGAMSYIGTCDPAANPNQVELVVVSLSDASGPLSFANPAPPEDPLVELVDCQPQADVSVTFEFTAAVAAEQGFFDVAISFDDIFCSAKFDCRDDEGLPLQLLFNPLTGDRDTTAVLGFACTAGPGQDTYLWMDPIEIICTGGGPFDVNTAGGPGNLDPYFPGPLPDTERLIYQAATYRGSEQLDATTSWNKAYWNVAIGLNEASFPLLDTCVLHGFASASNGDFQIGQTPPNVRWPSVQWDVPLIVGGASSCSRYQLDLGDEVKTVYTPSDGHRFYASYRAETGELQIQVGTPDATTIVVCADDTLNPGEQTLCVITPRQDGLLVPVEYQDFDGLTSSAGAVSGVTPQELSTSFTFTFTAPPTSQIVTIDTGVGATTTVTVLDSPDATSTITCAADLLLTGDSTVCTITAFKAGVPIYTEAASFSPSATPDGTVGAIAEPYGHELTFIYTAGTTTGVMTIGNGHGPTDTLTVYTIPDATSTLTCEDDRLLPGAQTVCTITPKREGVVVLAAASGFDVTSSPDGGIGAVNPNVGTSFTFLFTAPGTIGFKTIDIGFGDPAGQAQIEVYTETPIEELTLPTEPTITDAGGQDAQIWLTWDPPADSGGSTNLVYTAVCTAENGSGPTGTAVTASLEVVVTGLTNGTAYTCVVYATNELGDGPPSAPTDVIIPQPVSLSPGILVAMPMSVYGGSAFDPNVVESVSVIRSEPAVFSAPGVTPFDVVDADALVARPLTVYAAPVYDGGADVLVESGVVSPIVGTPESFVATFDAPFGQSFSGAVVAEPLSVYPRERADDGGLTSPLASGALVSLPGVFVSAFSDTLGASWSGAVVASPLTAYPTELYDDGGLLTVRMVSVLVAAPGAFVAGFDEALGDSSSGAIVAAPVAVYATERYHEIGLVSGEAVGAITAAPRVFAGNYETGFGASSSGAVVAMPLSIYNWAGYVDPTLLDGFNVSAIVSAPGAFVASPDMVLPDPVLGPPTIIDATALDGAIALTWLAPESDGGSPITSYTASCDDGTTTTSVTVATLTTVISGLTNGVAYTCEVFATNANGDGPPSDPTTALVPGSTPTETGAIVALPLGVYSAARYVPEDAADVGAIVAPEAVFSSEFDAGLGALSSGAVVAAPLSVYRASTFDPTESIDDYGVGAVVATPGVFAGAPPVADAAFTAGIVAMPLAVYPSRTFGDPTVHPEVLISPVSDTPSVYRVEPVQTAAANLSGAVVAMPLSVYGTQRFGDVTATQWVSVINAASSVFATGDDGLGEGASGAVVARPLAVYDLALFSPDAADVSVVLAPAAVFADLDADLGGSSSGPVVARPLSVEGAQRYAGAALDSSVIGSAPAVFADDGTAPVPTGPPGAPTITSAVGGDGTISLTWDPPVDNGGTPALIYTVTCSATFGVHVIGTTIGALGADLQDAHNGTTYSCVVTASNNAGEGPPSDPVLVTPLATSDLTGAVIAAPLNVYRDASFADGTKDETGALVSPAAVFSVADNDLGASTSGAVVAAPLGVYGASFYSPATTEEAGSGLVASAPAVFGVRDDSSANQTGAVVAAPLSVFGDGIFAAGIYDRTSPVAAAPSVFSVGIDDLGVSDSGAVVASPMSLYAATSFDALDLLGLVREGAVLGAPAVFSGDTDAGLGASDSGAVVAFPMTVVSTRSFDTTSQLGAASAGAMVSGPKVFAVSLAATFDQPDSGAVVAAPMTVYTTASFDTTTQLDVAFAGAMVSGPKAFAVSLAATFDQPDAGAVVAVPMAVYGTSRYADPALAVTFDATAIVAAPSVFADDPTLLGTGVVPATAPVIVDAWSTDQSITLVWDPPVEDGGSAVVGYTATCTAVDASDSGSVSTASTTGVVTGLTNGLGYSCVVVAHHAAGDGPPSDPSIVLVPGPAPALSGSVVAAPLAVGSVDGYIAPATLTPEVGAVVSAPSVFSVTRATDLGDQASGAVVARPFSVYGTDGYDPAGELYTALTSPTVAAPGVFSVEAGAAGALSGAVVARPFSVYSTDGYEPAGDLYAAMTSPTVTAPGVFSVEAGAAGALSGAVVARPFSVYSTDGYDPAGDLYAAMTSPTVTAPGVFSVEAGAAGALSGAVVATPLAVYSTATWLEPTTEAALTLGPILADAAVYTAAGFIDDLGQQASGAVVAQAVTVYATVSYDAGADAAEAGPVLAAPAVWVAEYGDGLGIQTSGAIVAAAIAVVGHPYVTSVEPSTLLRSDTSLRALGFALAEVAEVRLYEPGAATPSTLVTVGALSIDGDGALVVPVTFDPAAPVGIWQVQVVTGAGYASALNPDAAQQGFVITFTLSE
ncbi:MAG: fibronectin type III domain-containing protein [Deltaproteobacteria bacterium]|nr:MAG: fibronectin type III domain-containing protein [Deltaproteobacteria bacterium]